MRIRNLHPDNPRYLAWANRDRHSTIFASVVPTKQYNLTNEELYCAASASWGTPNPVCIPHIGPRLVRRAPEDDEDDAGMMRRGDAVDALGITVSARVQHGGPWKCRHGRFANYVLLVVQLSGVLTGQSRTQEPWRSARVNPALDVAYTDPGDGKEKIVELKFIAAISQCPSRYSRDVAASLCAAVETGASNSCLSILVAASGIT